ncbi:MAG: hypothetical protein HGA44_18020 [Cellulomonadaceae bacterium]|nr:hypothetical protein [Cellulomonadaceae bacterium]
MHAILLAAGESVETAVNLPVPAPFFGLAAFGALVALLGVAYAFRSVGTRH